MIRALLFALFLAIFVQVASAGSVGTDIESFFGYGSGYSSDDGNKVVKEAPKPATFTSGKGGGKGAGYASTALADALVPESDFVEVHAAAQEVESIDAIVEEK